MPIALVRRFVLIVSLSALSPVVALAAEPSGCAAFKWPIDRERAVLTSPNRTPVTSAAEIGAPPTEAMVLSLRPTAEAALPMTPGRAPAPDRFAGVLRIRHIAKAGAYTIALSAAGWVDVAQAGHPLKPTAFSGATDCDGIRKLVRYDLVAGDLLLQISGVADDRITLAIIPAD